MTEPVIDLTTFNNLKTMAGADFLPELIAAYFEDADRLFGEMRAALAGENCPVFSRAAHSLKGNSANFGATRLTGLARELEYLGKSGSLEGAVPKMDVLWVEYEQVKQALEALRDDV